MLNFNANQYPYPSQRNLVYASLGMVATSQPLAAQAGLDMLKKGGNAIDAAIATAACLTVVEPTSNGIGGDAFAIIYKDKKLHGLNASGKSPQNLTMDALKEKGFTGIPRFGFEAVTVPGCVSGWVELSKEHGKLPFKELLKPAIKYAKEGFPLSPTLAKAWESAFKIYQKHLTGEQYQHWFKTFAPNQRAPKVGELWKSPDHAHTLQRIADTNGSAFYHGDLAEKIIEFTKKHNGYMTLDDLKNHQVEWVNPISINYKGYDIWELPPNGQGLIALDALNTLNHFDLPLNQDSASYHKKIEALKIAFQTGLQVIADPKYMTMSIDALLHPLRSEKNATKINEFAQTYGDESPSDHGTVYLATADQEGNMVSFIQSNYMGFGSGLVVPKTGIALQNRGHNFRFDNIHPNRLQPNKRPYHTIIPGFITQENSALAAFGVMGGMMQPQGHLQVITNMVDHQLNPQSALDAPRWQWIEKNTIHVEPHFDKTVLQSLHDRGHNISISHNIGSFGRGQIIIRDKTNKTLIGATDMRTDSSIASW